jgi:hypothetical protein
MEWEGEEGMRDSEAKAKAKGSNKYGAPMAKQKNIQCISFPGQGISVVSCRTSPMPLIFFVIIERRDRRHDSQSSGRRSRQTKVSINVSILTKGSGLELRAPRKKYSSITQRHQKKSTLFRLLPSIQNHHKNRAEVRPG